MPFDAVSDILDDAVREQAFPCACLEVGTSRGVVFSHAAGHLTYGLGAAPASADTIFDLASLTKVLATMPLAMLAIDRGLLALDTLVAERVPHWRSDDRAPATIADLLEHCAGLTPHLPFYRDHHGRADVEHSIATLPLEYPVATRSLYSDLGFMLLAWILEDALQSSIAASFSALAHAVGAPHMRFRPAVDVRPRVAPTGHSAWRGRTLVGEVHDDNCAMLGGAAGHAGVFGTAGDVGAWARAWLGALSDAAPGVFGPEPLLRRFMQRSAVAGSSRALAWDTMLPTSSCGTRISPDAVGHTGFTGTSLWIDPRRDLYIVLLTNRVYPSAENQAILRVRPRVHDAVIDAFDQA